MACSSRSFGNDLAKNISHVFACRRVLTLSQSVGERLFQKGRSTAANCRHFTSLSAKETNALDLMHIFFMLVSFMNDGLDEQERTTGTFLLFSSKMIVDFYGA